MAVVHIALFYHIGIIRALCPVEAVRFIRTVFLPFQFQSISAHALNHLSHTVTRLRKPVCKAGGRSAQPHMWAELAYGPNCLGSWSYHLPTGIWKVDFRPFHTNQAPAGGTSRDSWDSNCSLVWAVGLNEKGVLLSVNFPGELKKKNSVAWVPPPEMLT